MSRNLASLAALVVGTVAFASPARAQNGLLGEYYNNSGTAQSPPPPPGSPAGGAAALTAVLTRVDATVDFGFATPPGPGVNQDDFMIAWSGFLTSSVTGPHSFQTRSDDGVRLWVNGVLVVDKWVDQGATDDTGTTTVNLTAATRVPIRLEFYENGGAQECRLRWDTAGGTTFVIIPTGALTPVDPPTTPVLNPVVGSTNPFPVADLSWSASTGSQSTSVITYEVLRGPMGGPYTVISPPGGVSGTTYTDSGFPFDVEQCYVIRALDRGILQSPDSNEECVTVARPPPRISDNDEGLWDDRCACGSSIAPVPPVALWTAACAAIAMLGFGRRRP